jgi:hypothetical protein
MKTLLKIFPWGLILCKDLFMKIAEPRVIRILHCVIYAAMVVAGIFTLARPPSSFENVLGSTLVYILGIFILTGGIFAGVAVLPGIWWLERVGLAALITGMGMYVSTISFLRPSPVGLAIVIAFIAHFVLRWLEIRRYQLAPRER